MFFGLGDEVLGELVFCCHGVIFSCWGWEGLHRFPDSPTRTVEMFVDKNLLSFVQVPGEDYVRRHSWVVSFANVSVDDVQISVLESGQLRMVIGEADPVSGESFVFVSEDSWWNTVKSKRPQGLVKALGKKRWLPLSFGSLVRKRFEGEVSVVEDQVVGVRGEVEYYSRQATR